MFRRPPATYLGKCKMRLIEKTWCEKCGIYTNTCMSDYKICWAYI